MKNVKRNKFIIKLKEIFDSLFKFTYFTVTKTKKVRNASKIK